MNSVLHPVGPQPPRVYWVRRLVVLAAVTVLVVVAVVAASAAFGGGARDGDPGGAPAAAAAQEDPAAPAEDATGEGAADDAGESDDAAPGTCAPGALTVTLTSDAETYEAGAQPTFTVAIRNSGEEPCTVDAGVAQQALVITSGADRIWSSQDCADVEGERLLLLTPGAEESSQLAWPRVRSDETCSGELPEPRAGTYTAVAVVAGVQSGTVVFGLA